ncbi:hypothetical protein OF83DRAFT_473930 [Amylostereum chailletii]|nr:hypothetical protein OF83DRAFT_473930 [Amylostereum chailletii]
MARREREGREHMGRVIFFIGRVAPKFQYQSRPPHCTVPLDVPAPVALSAHIPWERRPRAETAPFHDRADAELLRPLLHPENHPSAGEDVRRRTRVSQLATRQSAGEGLGEQSREPGHRVARSARATAPVLVQASGLHPREGPPRRVRRRGLRRPLPARHRRGLLRGHAAPRVRRRLQLLVPEALCARGALDGLDTSTVDPFPSSRPFLFLTSQSASKHYINAQGSERGRSECGRLWTVVDVRCITHGRAKVLCHCPGISGPMSRSLTSSSSEFCTPDTHTFIFSLSLCPVSSSLGSLPLRVRVSA